MNQEILSPSSGFFEVSRTSMPTNLGESKQPYVRFVEAMPSRDMQILASSYHVHKKLLDAGSESSEAHAPLCFVIFHGPTHKRDSTSSSTGMSVLATQYYEKIQGQLKHLSEAPEAEAEVEKSAVDSALQVIEELKRRELAPPALSWHGRDAVVMLWALGDTTYAITVTDGELGYTVRRDKKTIKLADSIKIDQFRLEDLR